MAGKPEKRFGAYYSRINIPLGNGRYKQKLIHLGTKNKLEADSRMIAIRQAEGAIKQGLEISFPWNNDKCGLEVVNYNITSAIEDYLRFKIAERIKSTSIERIKIALSHFQNTIGKTFSVKDITIEHIDLFKQRFSYQGKHSPSTINNNLSKIRALLGWLYDRGKIDCIPKISKLRVGKKLPTYITDKEWNKILNLDFVIRRHYGYEECFEEHWKRAFYFYRETGCRLSEPFNGQLDGNWLIIDDALSKTNRTREIFIPDELIEILLEMQNRVKIGSIINKRNRIQTYSKKFRYACDTIGIRKYFHCLRHTYAVRRYLQTSDIYKVAKELGHSTVKTTEIYTNFNMRRLNQDFPSIIKDEKSFQNSLNSPQSYMKHRIDSGMNGHFIVGKV